MQSIPTIPVDRPICGRSPAAIGAVDRWPNQTLARSDLAKTVLWLCLILATISTFHSRALADPPNFEEQVKPVFREACAGCHNAGGARGGLDLTSYSALMRGGSSGDIVVPGDPDASTLFQLLTHQREPHMPPNAPRRTEAELDVIRQWIAGGLIERKGGSAQAATKSGINLVAAPAMRRPAGPPIMPQGLPLQPISTPIRRRSFFSPRARAIAARFSLARIREKRSSASFE